MDKQCRIMVVDDEKLLCESIAGICRELGCEVASAENGMEALTLLRQADDPFDLLITDYKMPRMNGRKLIRHVRREFPEIEIIMITGHAEINATIEVMKEGTFDFILKPFNAKLVKGAIEKCIHHHEVECRNRQLEKEKTEDLEVGVAIQKRFLTDEKQVREVFAKVEIDVAIYNKAPLTVSGDFFYPKAINESTTGFFFADTCGHGVSAAMISMRILNFIESNRAPLSSPHEFLAAINHDIRGIMPTGRNVAAIYAIWDMSKNVFAISNAGQPYPILLNGEGVAKKIEVAGFPLGQLDGTFIDTENSWVPGDRLIFYTDGIIEAGNSKEDLYGEDRLMDVAQNNAALGLGDMLDRIIADLRDYTGGALYEDDTTLAIFELRGEH